MLNDTAHKILDIAEIFTQTRGFNAFSYKDIQNELGIKTASIHYYFPTKQDLAEAMIGRYLDEYRASLDAIKRKFPRSLAQLKALGDKFVQSAKNSKFCLCGMLASDILSLPPVVENQLNTFFTYNEKWIAATIRQGMNDKEIKGSVNPKRAAAHYLAVLEGGLLIARAQKSPEHLQAIIKDMLLQLKA